MLGCVAAAAGICVMSLVTGRAVLVLCGTRAWSWLAGPVGLAVLIDVAALAAGAAALLVLRRWWAWPPSPLVAGATALGAGVLALLPYAFNGLFGPLGPGFNDDLGFHYAWAEALDMDGGADPLIEPHTPGYPIGPHALAIAVAQITGGVEAAFGGLLAAVLVLTALTALALLDDVRPAARVVAAVVTGVTYVTASYYAQAMFKEPMLALFALAFVVALPSARGWRSGVPLGLVVAGALLSFSYPGLLILGAIAAAWLAVSVALDRTRWPAIAEPLGSAAAIAGVTVAAESGRLFNLSSGLGAGTTGDIWPGGNFLGDVSWRLVLGTWLGRDFRFPSEHEIVTAVGAVLAVALAAYAFQWWCSRRDVAVPVALLVVLVGYIHQRSTAVPYYSAKLLVIASPLLAVMTLRAAFASRRAIALAGAGLCVILLGASLFALRGAPVGDRSRSEELISLRGLVRDRDVLFLPTDHFVRWSLLGARLTAREIYGFQNAVPLSIPVPQVGEMVDADEVGELDRFDLVVTTRAAEPPPGWHAVRRTPSFVVWAPGGDSAAPRRTILGAGGWDTDGPRDGLGHPIVFPGDTIARTIDVPPGDHALAIQYRTPEELSITAGDLRATLPRSYDPPNDVWPVGTVEGGRPLRVEVRVRDDPAGRLPQRGSVGALVLTPVP